MAPVLRVARFREGMREFFAVLEGEDRAREIPGDPIALGRDLLQSGAAGRARAIAGLEWLPPCVPSKILGVGRNYREHIAELGHEAPREPLLFLKPPSSLLAHGGTIRLAPDSRRVDFEGELGVVIGRTARHVPEDSALDHVFGFTCVNDVTARDLQKSDVQFTRAKGYDTFCPCGPCVAVGLPPDDLTVETFVNGVRRQTSPVSRMIFGVARLVSYASRVMTLLPGDLIATGTPEGVGKLEPGDEVSVEIRGIGRLTSRVDADRAAL